MAEFLPFALPDIGDEEITEVVDSLRSGWITTGPKCKQFEQDFANFLGGNLHAVAVNSATAGLHLALDAIGIGFDDEVITTVHTFTATAEVVRYLGAHPVFVDIDPKTFNIDPSRIEAAITSRTKAIIVVHFAGLSSEMKEIFAIAKKHNLRIVEDAAHALPAHYQSKLIGTLDSDATVFSFYATKTISTGEGGMLVTRNSKIAERARIMRLHGINRDSFDRYTSTKPAWYYEVVAPGFKYNMTDIAASLGIAQLRKAWRFRESRARLALRYDSELADLPLELPPRAMNGDVHSWHLYVIRLTAGASVSRDEFIQRMFALGIGCSVHFIPLHLHPYWRDQYRLRKEDFGNSQALYECTVSLPLYTKMTQTDQTRVIGAIQNILAC